MPSFIDDSIALAVELQRSYSYSQRVQITVGVAALCGAYLRLVVARCSPSYASLLLLAPVVVLNVWLPLLFDQQAELLSRCVWVFLLMWLASYKAIGLCIGRGPLYGSWTVAQTTLLYIMPIYPSADTGGVKKGRLNDTHGSSSTAVLSFLANTTCLAVLAYALATYDMPIALKYYVYGLALYGFITFIMDGPAALLISLMDLKVVPPFDQPWLSETITDFWSRRWNNTTSLTLRALVYDPIVEGSFIKQQAAAAAAAAGEQQQQQRQQRPSQTPMWLRLLGMTATFAVSGLMHEIILYYVSPAGRYHPFWWFTFFTIQAPIIVVEMLLHKRLRAAKISVPRIVGIVYTTVCVVGTAALFWYPPLDRYTNIANDITSAVNRNVAEVVTAVQQLGQQWGWEPALAAAINPSSAV